MLLFYLKYVKRNVSFLDEDIPLLQLLDALRDIKSIPDSNPDDSIRILTARLADLPKAKTERLITLALSFNPSTRALLGALIEKYFPEVKVSKLNSLLTDSPHLKREFLLKYCLTNIPGI